MLQQVRPLGIVLSLHPRWAEAILSRQKTVEIRRRGPHVEQPMPGILYATAPVSAVVGCCLVESSQTGAADTMFSQFGGPSSLSRAEWDAYVHGADTVTALTVTHPRAFPPLALPFRPPQSWCWLRTEQPLHRGLLDLVEPIRES